MNRLLKSTYCLWFIIAMAFVIQSCRKDEQKPPIDPTIEKYFGDWKFTKIEYRHYYDYIPDSTGASHLVHTMETSENWQKTGKISMGTQEKELYIQWVANSTKGYYAYVKYDEGLLCKSGCEIIPYALGQSPGEYAAHHITDSTFNINLGHSGGGGSTSSNWEIIGVKL